MSKVYYANCSLQAVARPSFTLWSNMQGLMIVLADWGVEFGEFESGANYALEVNLPNYESYDEAVQICSDCVTVENMLYDTNLDLKSLTSWIDGEDNPYQHADGY